VVSEVLGTALQVAQNALSVRRLVVVGAGVVVPEPVLNDPIEEYSQLSRRGCHRVRLSESGGEPSVERAQGRPRLADVHRRDS
jgi:hypothetical protein